LVELIADAADLLGEVVDPAAEQVAVGQRGSLGAWRTAIGSQLIVAGRDFA